MGHPWKDTTYPYHAFVPETEEQASDCEEDNVPVSQILALESSTKKKMPQLTTGEACVGHIILKQFETGVFKGTVMTATKLRGRFLYHIVYEDGDSEDLNDKELKEGHEMYNTQTGEAFQSKTINEGQDDIASEKCHSGGETEGSEYGLSDEEEKRVSKKKRIIGRGKNKTLEPKQSKQKRKPKQSNDGAKKTPKQKLKAQVINVKALLNSGDKNSVTNMIIRAMTPDEKTEILDTAGKSLLVQAKKGMRVQAMKVQCMEPSKLIVLMPKLIMSHLTFYFILIRQSTQLL